MLLKFSIFAIIKIMLKTNLAILCLSNNYSRQIGKKLADFFELFYVDLNDILEYNLVDGKMLETAGHDYFEKERQKVIKSVGEYENTLVVANAELFLSSKNISHLFDNFIIIYLKFDKESLEIIESGYENKRLLYAINEEDKIFKSFANIVIDSTISDENNMELVKKELYKYLEAQDENRW